MAKIVRKYSESQADRSRKTPQAPAIRERSPDLRFQTTLEEPQSSSRTARQGFPCPLPSARQPRGSQIGRSAQSAYPVIENRKRGRWPVHQPRRITMSHGELCPVHHSSIVDERAFASDHRTSHPSRPGRSSGFQAAETDPRPRNRVIPINRSAVKQAEGSTIAFVHLLPARNRANLSMNERVTPGITPEEGVDFLVNRYFQGYNRNCSILYKQTVGIVCHFP